MIAAGPLQPGESPFPPGPLRAEPGAGAFLSRAWYDSLREGLPGFTAGTGRILDDPSRGAETVRTALPYFVDRRLGFSRLFSLPFSSYGGLAIPAGMETPSSAEIRELLRTVIGTLPRPTGLIQIIDFGGALVDAVPVPLETHRVFTHLLDLEEGFDRVWRERFDRRVRKFVRQSRRQGVRIVRADDPEGLDRYLDVARATLRRRGGRPYPPALLKSLLFGPGKGHSAVHLALKNDRVLAGSLHIYGGDAAFNWLTASYPDAWPDRPVQALLSVVMEEAARAGVRWYNLGASPPEAAGLVNFKEGFGAARREYFIHQYLSPAYRLARASGRLVRRLWR